jgi:outer membrane protein assembly factor BamE
MIFRFLICIVFVTLGISGCGLIYKQNIQQGNAIQQEDLDELYEGMNKRQVLFVLGTPSVRDPFNQNRWDYVQTFSRRGNEMVRRTVTVKFENDLLTDIIGKDDPFGATVDETAGDSGEVATFTKKPAGDTQADSQSDTQADSGEVATFTKKSASDPKTDPHAAAIQSAAEEALSTDPDIEAIRERTSEDREYLEDMELLDQTPDDGLSGPDIDG